ncbi:MAG: hypothetical protein NTV14_03875 [Coprothermobacterota bacterium]|nr:hypothetical protein [Coprothermobacterota bacterium]
MGLHPGRALGAPDFLQSGPVLLFDASPILLFDASPSFFIGNLLLA